MTTAGLQSVLLKVNRAGEHRDALDAEIRAFMADKPFRVDVQRIGRFSWQGVAVVKRSPPERWATVFGDFVHNLKSALDHLACALVRAKGHEPDNTIEFPVCLAADQWTKKAQKLRGASGKAVEQARELQPFLSTPPEKHPLALLHELDIHDKHVVLNLVVGAVTNSALGFRGTVDLRSFRTFRLFPLVDGEPIYALTASSSTPGNVRVKMDLDVVLDTVGAARGSRIGELLTTLPTFVDGE